MLGRLEHPREVVRSAGGGNETGAPGGRLGEDTSTTSSTFHGSVTDHGRARREAGLETSVESPFSTTCFNAVPKTEI